MGSNKDIDEAQTSKVPATLILYMPRLRSVQCLLGNGRLGRFDTRLLAWIVGSEASFATREIFI